MRHCDVCGEFVWGSIENHKRTACPGPLKLFNDSNSGDGGDLFIDVDAGSDSGHGGHSSHSGCDSTTDSSACDSGSGDGGDGGGDGGGGDGGGDGG